ncbi:MAG: transketolase C-terminal domain-containing protein, partial [Ilumatobacteraceae bacterium]
DSLAEHGIDATVWDPRVVKPLDDDMLDDAAAHELVITVEDGLRQGGAGTGIRVALDDRRATCQVRVLGVPAAYLPHAKPDVILAELGLDAAGIAAEARRLLAD